MKRVGDLDKLNREVLKDNVKIRITILTILAALTIGVFVYSVIKTDVIGFILDVILLGIFVFYLTCNIIIMPIENRRYKSRFMTDEDVKEINDYLNLIENEKSNVSKKEYLLDILKKYEEYQDREQKRKDKENTVKSDEITLEDLERFALENGLQESEQKGDSLAEDKSDQSDETL